MGSKTFTSLGVGNITKGTGLFCEGCDREFLHGETMLLTSEYDSPEMMEAFCVDCLAFELADETAIPEEFCSITRPSNNSLQMSLPAMGRPSET
jgi:hypothetical protein